LPSEYSSGIRRAMSSAELRAIHCMLRTKASTTACTAFGLRSM
jgi:hypothetical protein